MTMYFVAIVLPADLNKEIHVWKQYMWEHYQCKVGLKSPAHITLLPPFWMEEEKETSFISAIDIIAAQLKKFQITTNHFSAFKPRTIFVAVQQNEELERVKKATNKFFQRHNPYELKLDTRPFHPHITIATRDLYKKDFYEAWPKFEKEQYERSWEADGLSILRHNKKNWDVIHTSQFQTL